MEVPVSFAFFPRSGVFDTGHSKQALFAFILIRFAFQAARSPLLKPLAFFVFIFIRLEI